MTLGLQVAVGGQQGTGLQVVWFRLGFVRANNARAVHDSLNRRRIEASYFLPCADDEDEDGLVGSELDEDDDDDGEWLSLQWLVGVAYQL